MTTLAEQLKRIDSLRNRRAVYEDLVYLLSEHRYQIPSGFGSGLVPQETVEDVLADLQATIEMIRESEDTLANQNLAVVPDPVRAAAAAVLPLRRKGVR